MKYDIITLFPELIEQYCSHSIINRAKNNNIISINTINPRDFTNDKHRTVDDTPYGGGAGMVLMCEPIFAAHESVQKLENTLTIMLTPQGKPYNQQMAENFSKKDQLIFICGHYEGFDERIRTGIDLMEISLGDFVITGGELAALAVIDSTARLLPGVLGKDESSTLDSFSQGLLEYPQYTRPAEFRGMKVPDVLMSWNHKQIDLWIKKQSLIRTRQRRPDLFEKYTRKTLSQEEKSMIKEYFDKE